MRGFISLLFIGSIIALGLLIGRGTPQVNTPLPFGQPITSPSGSTASNSTSSPLAQGGGAPSGRLFVLTKNGTISQIDSVDIITKERKAIFSDKNSEAKIQQIANVNGAGDSIVLLLAKVDDPAGQLMAFKTDGSGTKTVLAKDFVSTDPPAISPDHTKLALVSFSNAESSFGFTLFLMNIDGSNKKELAKDKSGISRIAFSPDGKQLAFVKGAAASSSQIAVVSIDNGKSATLYSNKDKIIEDFGWSSVGPLVMTAVSAEKSTDKKTVKPSEVYVIDPKNKSIVQATNNGQSERTPKVAPDATGLAFIENKSDSTKPGDIIVTLLDGTQPLIIGSGSQLVGWTQ